MLPIAEEGNSPSWTSFATGCVQHKLENGRVEDYTDFGLPADLQEIAQAYLLFNSA